MTSILNSNRLTRTPKMDQRDAPFFQHRKPGKYRTIQSNYCLLRLAASVRLMDPHIYQNHKCTPISRRNINCGDWLLRLGLPNFTSKLGGRHMTKMGIFCFLCVCIGFIFGVKPRVFLSQLKILVGNIPWDEIFGEHSHNK